MNYFCTALLAFLLLLQPAPAPFTAHWQRPNVARLAWSVAPGVHETCLIKQPSAGISVLIGCWYDLPVGPTGLTLGDAGPMDASFRPTAGDTFTLTMDGAASTAQLRGVVYLGVMRR
jgi:hypothetical protein